MDVYKAITEAGIESGEQLFRSIEKYSSDGKWDFNDTGATGVDVAILWYPWYRTWFYRWGG